jgi:predicted RNA binding protein YcfA (HicA-like mRNA interferase family)
MTRLPSLTARKVVTALERAGFVEDHQRGSHLHLWHPEREVVVTVPMHAGDLPRGTLRAIVEQSGLSKEEFVELL